MDCQSDERLVEYRIEDLQEERFEDAVNIIRDKHLIDEPMKSSKGVRDCPISVQEMSENLWSMLRQNISLVCYKEGSDEIVAVNILGVITEAESDITVKVRSGTVKLSIVILNRFGCVLAPWTTMGRAQQHQKLH